MMHSRPFHAVALLAAALLAAGPSACAAQATTAPFPLPIIELKGNGTQLGAEHARRLSDRITLLREKYLDTMFIGAVHRALALKGASSFAERLLPHHRAELQALAKGMLLDEPHAMLGSCFLDLLPMVSCSTIALPASASPDGIARMGRNLDFPSRGVADRQTVVVIFRPEGRYAFAAITWPGMLGVLSGMNEHGLALANMEVSRMPRLPSAMPYALLYRTVLEQCRTVDEAIALLEKSGRQTANNLMLMDAAGGRTVVEILPEKVTVRRAAAEVALISTNHQRGQDQDTAGRCWRYDTLRRSAAQQHGRIDVAAVQSLLARVMQGKFTMQSMVFEPSTRTIYLATGLGAARQPFHRLELKPYFR